MRRTVKAAMFRSAETSKPTASMPVPFSGWRRERGDPALSDVHGTIRVPTAPGLRKLFAFVGPGYLVAVGYMDPGNWATSLAGGSKFGYALLTVALLSNLMAILLQALCARLGVATGRDLAQACRDSFPRPVAWALWALAEAAICATDLAEVIGTAIGLNLLFGIPLEIGVILTAADVFLILWLQNLGFRWIEALIVSLLGVIAACFAIQIALADPDWGAVIRGFAPTTRIVTNPDMLYLALGILGATVMPHNLYLHSAIVQTRRYGDGVREKREAVRLATIDSTVALMLALTVNASILILAAQAVMEGFLDIRLPPWLRRLVTRAIAIVPAAAVTVAYGESGTSKLLILSQVILSLQLSFAVVPLVMFTADRAKMGELVTPKWMTALAACTAFVIILLNLKLLVDFATGA